MHSHGDEAPEVNLLRHGQIALGWLLPSSWMDTYSRSEKITLFDDSRDGLIRYRQPSMVCMHANINELALECNCIKAAAPTVASIIIGCVGTSNNNERHE